MFILKFVIYFSISFIILSIPVSNESKLFNFIDHYTAPYTSVLFFNVKSGVKKAVVKTKKLTKKLISNTEVHTDKLEQSSSSLKKDIDAQMPDGQYTNEEREAILNILKD